ncbi:MAG: NHL domain-containing thioredoxin family protein [Actinomycetes bacterium]
MTARLRAPELAGRGWLNTGGRALSLSELRGRFLLLDFWTFCCANCLHVLDELRPLEEKYADQLTIIGVHSPKFEHETDAGAVTAAVERYDVRHPVLDDPELITWKQYAARAWPTLVLIDPEGYIVAQLSGEGHAHALDALLSELVAEHTQRGTLQAGDDPYVAPAPQPSVLSFPSKAVRLSDGTFLVADASHHSLAHLDSDAETLLRRIGSGDRGLVDGASEVAQFNEPNGLCLLPPEVASWVGYDLVVADTVNHALRGVRLSDGFVQTVAGTGVQWMAGDPFPGDSDPWTPLNSPWDVTWFPGWHEVAVAMAGNHQVWSFDPVTPALSARAGTAHEGLVDGDVRQAWFAQTSGLSADDDTLWLADSETSSLRRIRNGVVHTEVGTGLFDFGFVDGDASEAMLQHPLDVLALPDGSVLIADTYNGAVRRFDPAARTISTLARDLAEPSGLVLDGDTVVVVESAAHRLTRVPLSRDLVQVSGERLQTHRPATGVRAGRLGVRVDFTPPPGQKLDDRYGPSAHLVISSTPAELLVGGAGSGTELVRDVVVSDTVSSGVIHVSARAASCDDGFAEFAACHVHQQDWGIPVIVSAAASATTELTLPLAAH